MYRVQPTSDGSPIPVHNLKATTAAGSFSYQKKSCTDHRSSSVVTLMRDRPRVSGTMYAIPLPSSCCLCGKPSGYVVDSSSKFIVFSRPGHYSAGRSSILVDRTTNVLEDCQVLPGNERYTGCRYAHLSFTVFIFVEYERVMRTRQRVAANDARYVSVWFFTIHGTTNFSPWPPATCRRPNRPWLSTRNVYRTRTNLAAGSIENDP